MRILGIDPGTGILGFGVIQVDKGKSRLVDAGVIRTPVKEDDAVRLQTIYEELTDIIAQNKPAIMSVEKLFFAQNVTTAMTVAQARGVVLLCGQQVGLKIHEYTPLQVKQAITGYGRADKKQIQEMVRVILGLKEVPKPDDCADALAAALTHGSNYEIIVLMIATISGIVSEKLPDMVVLEAAGVGYGLFVTTEDHSRMVQGEQTRVYIYEHIREQSHDLFGFVSLDTKRLFELLLSVNGVGPKMALAILSIGSANDVRVAIASGDVKFIQAAQGVGKRVAERVVVDLKDKVGLAGVDLAGTGLLQGENVLLQDEAVEALVALGYSPVDAATALQKVDIDLPAAERIKLALKG